MAEWVGHYVKMDESATAYRQISDKLNGIVIPQLEFRQANIVDVVKFLDQASITNDKDPAHSKKGVNFILQLKQHGKQPGTAAETAPGTASNLPVVTLALFEKIMASLTPVVAQVKVQADHIEITDPATAERFQRQAPTAEELRNLPSTAFRRHSALAAITKSGQNTEAKSVATSNDSSATNEIEIGTVLNCTPTVGPDGYTIDFIMLWQSNKPLGTNPPRIASMMLAQNLTMQDGKVIVLPVQYQESGPLAEKATSPNPQYVILAVTLVDPAGQPINKPPINKPAKRLPDHPPATTTGK